MKRAVFAFLQHVWLAFERKIMVGYCLFTQKYDLLQDYGKKETYREETFRKP